MATQARFGPNSRSLSVEFDSTDVPGSVLIGRLPLDVFCQSCVVEIDVAFDGGTSITVGDIAAHGRLQAVADNDPSITGDYEVLVNYAYSSGTDLYVFLTGTAAVGHGRVIVYM